MQPVRQRVAQTMRPRTQKPVHTRPRPVRRHIPIRDKIHRRIRRRRQPHIPQHKVPVTHQIQQQFLVSRHRRRRAAPQFLVRPRVRECLKHRLATLITRTPRRRLTVVHRRMHQLKAVPHPVRPSRPLPARIVNHRVSQILIRILQPDPLSTIPQRATHRPQHPHTAPVRRRHPRRIVRHHQKCPRSQRHARRKIKINPFAEPPP